MKIKLAHIKVSEVFKGYKDKDDEGVVGFGGNLDIRPPYQRNYVYNQEQAEAVIHTVLRKPAGYPLNVMYWVLTNGSFTIGDNRQLVPSKDAKFEILDGQQRTIALMQYLDHKYPITHKGQQFYCDSLPDDEYQQIMDYELMVYICEGTASEKLEWFEVVNIAGERLTKQELRNKSYTGEWLSDAKAHFSKRNCAAYLLSNRYVNGDPNRQELLEKALTWIAEAQKTTIEEYMSNHQKKPDADELWQYYQDVINWLEKIFPIYDSSMKGLDWGHLYNKYHMNKYNSSEMAKEVKKLLADEEVQKKKGIYEYLLSKDSNPFAGRLLNLRQFSEKDKKTIYQKQNGICPICGKYYKYEQMHGDHIKPWSKGGLTEIDNLQMLCADCNSKKSDQY